MLVLILLAFFKKMIYIHVSGSDLNGKRGGGFFNLLNYQY